MWVLRANVSGIYVCPMSIRWDSGALLYTMAVGRTHLDQLHVSGRPIFKEGVDGILGFCTAQASKWGVRCPAGAAPALAV